MPPRKNQVSGKPQLTSTPKKPPDPPKKEQSDEDRPDMQFERDFSVSEDDVTFAYRYESAIEMESDLEAELEQKLKDETPAESWQAAIIKQGWAGDPCPITMDDFIKYRTTPDALAAMKIRDPFEAMLAAECSALHTNMLFNLRKATTANSSLQERESRYKIAIKLGTLYSKLIDTLAKYRRGGEQKVSVKYERVQRRKGRRAERQRVTISHKGPGAEFDPLGTAPKADPIMKTVGGSKAE